MIKPQHKRDNAEPLILTIDKLVFGGEGLGHIQGRPVFVAGVFPGEEVLVQPVRILAKITYAHLIKVMIPSPLRHQALHTDHLALSPWETLALSQQHLFKEYLVQDVFSRTRSAMPFFSLTPSPQTWGYRHKMVFHVGPNGQLAVQSRYEGRLMPWDSSVPNIAHEGLIQLALATEAALKKFSRMIEKITIRFSEADNQGVVMIHARHNIRFPMIQLDHPHLSGWTVFHGTDPLQRRGQCELTEEIEGRRFSYPPTSFFQVNPAAFTLLVRRLKEQAIGGALAVDLYAGVGVIGLMLADKYRRLISLESDPDASLAAARNAQGVSHVEVRGGRAEDEGLATLGSWVDTLIVNPPRSGLPPKVIQAMIKHRPRQLIYVSCDAVTQARDWRALAPYFQITHMELFDLFPHTPHVESLIVATCA